MNRGHKVFSFDIWGSCVSRDIFGIADDTGKGISYPPRAKLQGKIEENTEDDIFRYVINYYFQACSAATQFTEHVGPNLTMEDLSSLNLSNARKKWALNDFNKDVLDILLESSSEWIIIDLRSEIYDSLLIKYYNESNELVTCNGSNLKSLIESKEYVSGIERLSYNIVDHTSAVDKLIEFCNMRYGNNIILIESLESVSNLDTRGDIHSDVLMDEEIAFMLHLNSRFIEKTNCYYVKSPFNIISDRMHKWGYSKVHYVEEYYLYAFEAIKNIVTSEDDTVYRKLDMLYIGACATMARIRSGIISSINNTLKRADLNIAHGNDEYAFLLINKLIEQDEPRGMAWVARQYRNGKGVEKNLTKAAEWMRKAANKNLGWAKNELFDILWCIGTPESYDEMMSVAAKFADEGNGGAMARLGRAYRDGKGVEKNLDRAIEWMRKAANKNLGWAKNELFDILWKRGELKDFIEAKEVAESAIEIGDLGGMGRLGRAYRDGKGVEKNLNKAAEWMRKAISRNDIWRNELFDVLWLIDTPESHKEMISVISESVQKGNGGAIGRLGRAYRYGKGKEKDLLKAADLMREATNTIPQWNEELEEIEKDLFESSLI